MITCANCQTQNPEDKKFCRECGTPIIPTAPSSPKQEAAQPPPPTTVASTKPVLSKKKSKWWIWLILVVVLAAVAYLAFFEGGMGSFLPVKKGSPGSSARNETDLIEKLVESFQNQDPYGFVDNYCLSRADLDEFNRLLPESSKFDVKEASGEIPEIASKLRDDWNEIMKRSNEVNWDWASTKVISVSSEKTDSNPKLFTGIYAVIESEGKRYGLFLESCAKFSVGFKVCKELEWTGKDDGSDPFSENQSDQGDKTTEDSLVKELARINPEEKATERVQAEQKKKIPDQKGLQKDDEGYYDLTYHDGRLFRYKGELLNGQAHGIGQAIFPDGYKYQGEFKNNKFDGEAIETFIDGVKFTGTFTNGYRHGTGTIIWINGSSYTGDWASGWRTGHGAYSWGDGARFEGEWKQNQRIHGKMLYADGNTYEGEYAEDVLHGNGTYTFARHSSKTLLCQFYFL